MDCNPISLVDPWGAATEGDGPTNALSDGGDAIALGKKGFPGPVSKGIEPSTVEASTLAPIQNLTSPVGFNNSSNVSPVNNITIDIYVFDQANSPIDDGTNANTYTATIYLVWDGVVMDETFRGSSYPNTINGTDDGSTQYNTTKEGSWSYHNRNGHTPVSTGVTVKGLNIDNDNDPTKRTVPGTKPDGTDKTMTNVNVHSGCSNNGNYNSRGSQGCITLHPDDYENFMSYFDWSGTGGVRGNSEGTIHIFRGSSGDGKKNELERNLYLQEHPIGELLLGDLFHYLE